MRNIIAVILFVLLSGSVKAQHCGWDGTFAIILDVRDSLTNEIIYDLDIILTDSTGRPYTSDWNIENYSNYSIYQNTDTLKFGLNTSNADTTTNTYSIPFGINNYMLFVYPNNYPNLVESGHDKIIIHDKRGRYESIIIDKIRIIHLCTNNQIWHSNKVLKKATTKIKLKKTT